MCVACDSVLHLGRKVVQGFSYVITGPCGIEIKRLVMVLGGATVLTAVSLALEV